MPVYEYQCTACHKEFEYQQRMADPDKTICEACGGALERLISRTAFTLKGSGWYKDLYASAKPAEAKKESSDAAAPAKDAPASTKAEPAAAPAPTTPSSGGSSGGGDKGGGGSTSASAVAKAS